MIETPQGRMIVKEAMGAWPLRALRRAMLRREHAIYQRLQGVRGVPRCYGLQDSERLLIEYVAGPSLRDVELPAAARERFFDALLTVILALHRAGVAHADLKRKNNILLGPDSQPVLIDFGSAIAEGSGRLRRGLFRQVCRMDLNAWIKLKYRRQYDRITPADRVYYRPTWLERAARLIRENWRTLTARRWRKARRSR
jgi:predicted Ser/Thr protein kinase